MKHFLRMAVAATWCGLGGSLVKPLDAVAAEDAAAESTQVYGQEYFQKYDVSTAEDLVRRIPGTTAILDAVGTQQQQRGFGSGGDQILLNGNRFAGKGQILPTLRRIQSANVERIELIRGTSGDLNVLSEGLIINVVLKEGVGTGAGSWEARARISDLGSVNGDGSLSYSNSWGILDYIVGFERMLWSPPTTGQDWTFRKREETYFFPSGAPRELRYQTFTRYHNKLIGTANLTFNFPNGDRLRLNGLAEPRNVHEDDDTSFLRFDASGQPQVAAVDVHRKHTDWLVKWDVGGDYVKSIGTGTLSVLFINSYQRSPIDEFRNLDFTNRLVELSRNRTAQQTGETILRSSYSWPVADGQTLELGGEGARNILKQYIRVYFDRDANGTLEEVTIPTAEARVQELRGEAFANHNWQISPKLSLESSFNVEFSEISNNYPFSPSRLYVIPKPRADLRYNLTGSDQFRFKVERTASQLQFANFVPTFDVVDSEIDAGNPDLKPEKTWKYEFNYQKTLAQGQGRVEGRVFYNDIHDHIDKFIIRVEPNGERVSAIGNIGRAKQYGFETKGSIRMSFIGLPDLVVDGRFLRQLTRTTDPFTGERRGIALGGQTGGPWKYEVDLGFRHDVTGLGFSYGAKYEERGGKVLYSDIRVQRLYWRGPRLEAFVEKKLGGGLIARIEGYGLYPARSREFQERLLYADDVISGTVSRFERYVERRDRRFTVSLRGTF